MPESFDSRHTIRSARWAVFLSGSRLSASGLTSAGSNIHHPGSTAGFKPATAPAGLLPEVFSGDTQKDCKLTTGGDDTIQSVALKKVTKSGTELLRAEEVCRVIRKSRDDYLANEWLPSQCDDAIAAARAEYELTETEHKTAVNEAKEAECTQQSVENAKTLAKTPGWERGIATSVKIYYDMARYPLAASEEGGSGGGTENVRRERSSVYQEGAV